MQHLACLISSVCVYGRRIGVQLIDYNYYLVVVVLDEHPLLSLGGLAIGGVLA